MFFNLNNVSFLFLINNFWPQQNCLLLFRLRISGFGLENKNNRVEEAIRGMKYLYGVKTRNMGQNFTL